MLNKTKSKKFKKYETLKITARVDADGDVYVKGKGNVCYYVGYLTDEDRITEVPNHIYKKIKRILIKK
ncbi:MAG: hypothetical protein WC438_06370 [Candidatus Pacearchaeota archaeon]